LSSDAESIVREYIEAADRHGSATDNGDFRSANKAYKAIIRALHDLDDVDQVGRHRLVQAFDHPNLHVRVWAATHLLRIRPERAIAALTQIAAGRGLAALDAEIVLSEWHKGTLQIP